MRKTPLFIFSISIFLMFGFGVAFVQAAGLGEQCFSDSDCGSGNCADKESAHFAAVCMPSSYSSDTTVNINSVDTRPGMGNAPLLIGQVQYKTSGGQSYFNSLYPGAEWVQLQWSGYFCGQTVHRYRYYEGSTEHYKATDGTKYWHGSSRDSDIESVMINALDDMICKTASQAPQKKSNGLSCSSASECLSNYCVHSYCRSSAYFCGDSYCDSSVGESCSSCSDDCGSCKKPNSYSCSSGSECSGGYCVHGYCRSAATFCSDSYCDSGESCSSCDFDCGSCAPTPKIIGESCSSGSECFSGSCVHGTCRSGSYYCGDSYCDSGESCSSCSGDCGACAPVKKSNGSSCLSSSECQSGFCYLTNSATAGICCQSYQFCCGNNSCDSGESCSSCSSDCGSCAPVLKSNGASCSSGSECSSSYCVHGTCRSSSIYCGDNYCDSGEDSSSCFIDCGTASKCGGLKCDLESCSSNSECQGYCVHSKCRSGATYCGDSYCDSGESCSSCSGDCGKCLKKKGESCLSNSECDTGYCGQNSICCDTGYLCCRSSDRTGCPMTHGACDSNGYCSSLGTEGSYCLNNYSCKSGYCVHNTCRSSSVYCGDNHCDSGESASSCSQDCQSAKKSNGTHCNLNSECFSNNCRNNRCCVSGKDCCFEDNNCSSKEYCSLAEERYYCMPDLELGRFCTANNQCLSKKCEKNICCSGDKCCQNSDQCANNEYCDTASGYRCRYKWNVGENCDSPDMCKTGYCDTYTRQCAEKPPESAKPESVSSGAAPEAIPEVTAGSEIEFFNLPTNVRIKKDQQYSVSIVIKNTSPREVILAEAVEVENLGPFVVKTNLNYLRIPIKKTKLLPGESASNVEINSLNSFDMLRLTGKNGGDAEIKIKMVYFVNRRAKITEIKLPVTVIPENIKKEVTASSILGEEVNEVEKIITKDLATGENQEVVLIEPENKELYQATANAWEKAREQQNEATDDLKDDFMGQVIGGIKPVAVAFFETIKQLNKATTQKEVTETALRTMAPPTMAVGFDLANLADALSKKQREEKALAKHFGSDDIKTLSVYDKNGKVIGKSRVVIVIPKGLICAVKLGDL